MKKILFLLSILLSFLANAQMKEGKVLYERTIQMQFRGDAQFRSDGGPPPPSPDIPRERKDRFELSFANNQSLWESMPEMDDNNNFGGGGEGAGGFRVMRFGGSSDLSYHNFTTGKRLDEQELSSKKYIVEDSIQKIAWKMTDQTKTILGHTVQKVSGERYGTRTAMTMENGEMKRQLMPDTTIVNAWIAMDIPVPAGPEQFQGQLPGLILELEMNNGRIVYRALEISSKVNVSAIKEPKGGKRITAAEFTKLRDKEFEEMRRNMPAGGGRRVQIVTQ
jgi:GLPGLI family protein